MTTLIGMGVITIALAVILYFARKAGKDAVKAETNEAALKDVLETARPSTVVELDRVRRKYSRD